jgi:hypothetical protein
MTSAMTPEPMNAIRGFSISLSFSSRPAQKRGGL